jgi:hypothetical protein
MLVPSTQLVLVLMVNLLAVDSIIVSFLSMAHAIGRTTDLPMHRDEVKYLLQVTPSLSKRLGDLCDIGDLGADLLRLFLTLLSGHRIKDRLKETSNHPLRDGHLNLLCQSLLVAIVLTIIDPYQAGNSFYSSGDYSHPFLHLYLFSINTRRYLDLLCCVNNISIMFSSTSLSIVNIIRFVSMCPVFLM